jgi:hypothetical protein
MGKLYPERYIIVVCRNGRESVDSLPSGGKIYYSENDILLIDLVKIYGGFVIKLTIITFKNF